MLGFGRKGLKFYATLFPNIYPLSFMLSLFQPAKTQPSGKKDKKSKEKGKRKETISTTCDDNVNHISQGNNLTAEELVMTATGCKVILMTLKP